MEFSFLLLDVKSFKTKIEYCTICLAGGSCLAGVTPRHGARQMNQLGGGGAAGSNTAASAGPGAAVHAASCVCVPSRRPRQ